MKVATLLAGVAIAISASHAQAFCVYNKIDQPFTVMIRSGGSAVDPKTYKNFSKTIQPGKDQCCNWKNKDCNHSGKRETMLTFSNYLTKYHGKDVQCRAYGKMGVKEALSGSNLQEPTMQAGGYATLERNGSFNGGKDVTEANAPYVLKSWSYDDKPMGEKPCF